MEYSPPGSSVHGFPRQEYWSGLPFPSLGDLHNPGIEPASPALAAAAKSLQSCLTLCDPIDGSPPGSPVPGILQGESLPLSHQGGLCIMLPLCKILFPVYSQVFTARAKSNST